MDNFTPEELSEAREAFDNDGRINRGLAKKLPFWATDAERAEVDNLDTQIVLHMARRGANVRNGFYAGGITHKDELALRERIGNLTATIKERKGAAPEAFEDWIAIDPPSPKPDLAIAQRFWSFLSPDDSHVRLRFLKEGATTVEQGAGDMAGVWPLVEKYQAQGYAVYYVSQVTNVVAPGSGWAGMVEDVDVTGIRCLAADFDNGLPAAWHVQPDILVKSSVKDGVQRGQAIWRVTDCSVDSFAEAQGQLAAHYGSDASIVNPSRILRLPGSIHQRNGQLVTFLADATTTPRPLAAIVGELPPAPARKAKATPAGERTKVDPDALEDLLRFIDPACPSKNPKVSVRNIWMGIISALKNMDAGTDSLDIVQRWSRGEFWPGGAPPNCASQSAVETAFLTSDGSASFGTIMHHAKAGGWVGTSPWEPPPGDIVYSFIPEGSGVEDVVQQQPPKPKAKKVKLHRVSDIMSWPEPVELVEGLLIERENVAFVGTPKSGKTFIALDCALSLAAGVPVLGTKRISRRGIVIYLSGEGHIGMQARIGAWLAHRGLDVSLIEDTFFYNKGVPTTTDNEAANLAECGEYVEAVREEEGEPVLVVIDTMARSLRGADENSAPAANLYLDMTETLRNALDCTVMTVAHASNKKGGDPDDFRGSSALSAGFDSTWITKKNGDNNTVQLKAKYLKEADESKMEKVFFQLTETPFGDGRKGIALVPVAEAVFNGGRDGDTGQYASKGTETPALILAAMGKMPPRDRPDSHARGIGHTDLAKALLANSKPAGATGQLLMGWMTEVNKCADRLKQQRNRSPKDYAHLGSSEVPGLGEGVKNVWRWHLGAIPSEEDCVTAA